MKKLIYLIVLALILGLALTGCSLLSNVGQVPATGQKGMPLSTANLIALWHFDEVSGSTTVDSSLSGGNDGTVFGANLVDDGKLGKALNFDGGDYVQLPASNDILSIDTFTIEAWFKTSVNHPPYGGAEGRIVNLARDAAGHTAVALYVEENNIAVCYHNGGFKHLKYAVTYNNEVWHHIAVTRDATTYKLYYDGSLVASQDDTFYDFGTSAAYLGTYNGSERFFIGLIDEVRIWDGALTAEQIFYSCNDETLHVDDDWVQWPGAYKTITEALAVAGEGDTIKVHEGIYNEVVVINKSLTLQGAGSVTTTVIGAQTITASDVIIDGFKLDGGITLDDSVNLISCGTISNNIITGANNTATKAENGIRLGLDSDGQGVDHVTIKNNTITNNSEKGIRFSNTKEHIGGLPQHISNITISGNEIKNNGSAGIETYGPGSNTITGNTISGNDGNGINLKFDDDDVVTGNTITNNLGPGITLRQVTNTVVENNSVSDHQSEVVIKSCPSVLGGKGSGIHIFDVSENNTIRFNDISGNNYGIFIHSGKFGSPLNNSISYNNIAGSINYGILNALVDPPAPVNATRNWWGHASGPGGPDGRLNGKGKEIGKGDKVSANVDWDPWLPQSVGHTPHDPVPPGLLK